LIPTEFSKKAIAHNQSLTGHGTGAHCTNTSVILQRYYVLCSEQADFVRGYERPAQTDRPQEESGRRPRKTADRRGGPVGRSERRPRGGGSVLALEVGSCHGVTPVTAHARRSCELVTRNSLLRGTLLGLLLAKQERGWSTLSTWSTWILFVHRWFPVIRFLRRAVECTELSASPSSQESLRRLPWCTCVSASGARHSRAQCKRKKENRQPKGGTMGPERKKENGQAKGGPSKRKKENRQPNGGMGGRHGGPREA